MKNIDALSGDAEPQWKKYMRTLQLIDVNHQRLLNSNVHAGLLATMQRSILLLMQTIHDSIIYL